MKKITSVLLLVALAATPSLAGLKFVATPNQASYASPTTGNLALSVDLDAMPAGSIQFVTGPALSASPISFFFAPQAGATGPAPAITGTETNSAGGWNPVIAPTTNTFTAFNFAAQALPPSELIGQVNFNITTDLTNGVFDLVATAFSLDGVDFPQQTIGSIAVSGVAIPEPSSFLFLGLVGSGIAGVQVLRRRKSDESDDQPAETEAVV